MGLVDRLDCGSGDDEASDLSKVRSSRRLDRVHSVRDIPRVEDVRYNKALNYCTAFLLLLYTQIISISLCMQPGAFD